jgi:hypothetical protein
MRTTRPRCRVLPEWVAQGAAGACSVSGTRTHLARRLKYGLADRADRFDTLARSLHASTTRRTALVAGVGATLATLLGIETAAAACKTQGAKCKKAGNCCSNYCRKFSKKKKKCWCKRLGEPCASASNCCRVPIDYGM